MKYIFLAAAVLTLAACRGPKEAMTPAEAAALIETFTPERIAAGTDIEVTFVQAQDTTKKAKFSFKPSLKGKTKWLDEGRKLVFTPREGAMKPGNSYDCRMSIEGWEKDLVFKFYVSEREGRLTIDRIVPTDREHAAVEGTLTLSEATQEDVQKLLNTSAKGAKVTVSGTGNKFSFRIEDIERDQLDKNIEIKFDADAIGFGEALTERVSIPGSAEFKVLSAELAEADTPYIDISFSDALDPAQELEGLVAIDRLSEITIQRPQPNIVRVLFDRGNAIEFTLRIAEQVRAQDGRRLQAEVERTFSAQAIAPAVEVPLSGTILPDGNNLALPFKAVNLAAVDVQVFKIYQSNVLHFLQDNELDEGYRLRRAGKLIFAQTVRLDTRELDLHKWQNFSIDLKNLFKQEKGAIYRIKLSFKHDYSLYGHTPPANFEPLQPIDEIEEDVWLSENFDWNEWDWDESDDPTKPSYFMESDRFPEYSLMASNIGMIVKAPKAGGKIWAACTDIMDTAPMSGVRLTAYNYQVKEIGSATTGSDGMAEFAVSDKPFVITASKGNAISYLKVEPAYAKSLSRFDVGGKEAAKGLKGYAYGERGVWRPGDTVHLVLVVEDKGKSLPAGHPVSMELRTPQGQVYDSQTTTHGPDGFFRFDIATSPDDPTGSWQASFKAGGQTFNKAVRIEAIVPNRLKIEISTPTPTFQAGTTVRIDIESHWLTGPPAAGLTAMVERTFKRHPQPFEAYKQYSFDNPLTTFASDTREWGTVRLDSAGRGALLKPLAAEKEVSGMMMADLLVRVAEPGGATSIMSHTVNYSPYEAYAGINIGSDKTFETDKDLNFDVVSVSPAGHPMQGRQLEWKVYKLEWSWWWEYSAEKLNSYIHGTSADVVASGSLTTGAGGKAAVPFKVEYPKWGKYLVLVRDPRSGHATGGVIYVDWPSWRGRSDKGDSESAQMLSFTLDKASYEVGDRAVVYIPAAENGRALVSIENSAGVLSREWVKTSAKETQHKIAVTKEMQPNCFVHITLLQPHANSVNDLPIRMYGVQPVTVTNKASHLTPVIKVPEVVRPQQPFTVRVSEQKGRAMTYTLAIVDEGLLDISGFRTPDLWGEMNRREALGVRTWDVYDDVVGAYSGQWMKILSIGGDEALNSAAQKEKRFNPVVKFMGPFTLRGGSKTHNIELPMYVGSVKVMVVAGRDGAYGSADKTVTVRSPLMVLSTLPRQISNGERVTMPVNVFALEDGVRGVQVSVRVEGPLKGATSKTINFTRTGDQLVDFELTADASKEGMAKVFVSAQGGGHTATETINIEVRNPNPMVVTSQNKLVEAGAAADFEWTNAELVQLEVAGFPAIDFAGTFEFARYYRHLCSEQLSSRAFNMLFARRFLDASMSAKAADMIPLIIKELCTRQLSSGGFIYWPGSGNGAHDWVSSMAGQALLEAQAQSFAVPAGVIDKWLGFQQRAAREYRHSADDELQQAYRLYTLALAKKPDAGAMNKLRETRGLKQQTIARLAAAYCIAGRNDVAAELLKTTGELARPTYATFGSPQRDRAMMLETQVLAGQTAQALKTAAVVAREFSSSWCSTQQVAFVSLAMSRLADVVPAKIENVSYTQGAKTHTVLSPKPVFTQVLDAAAGRVSVQNKSKAQIAANVMVRRKPSASEHTPAVSEGVSLAVRYTDLRGTPMEVSAVKQGAEFVAHITVTDRTGTTNVPSMALTFMPANGWEIFNERRDDEGVSYKDIRDDRVSWYFALNAGRAKTFTVRLRATYIGTFLLPAAVAEDMYEPRYRAATASGTVVVND